MKTVYHFCLLHQPGGGVLKYRSGTTERSGPIGSNSEYNYFMESLSDELGINLSDFVLISLNRL